MNRIFLLIALLLLVSGYSADKISAQDHQGVQAHSATLMGWERHTRMQYFDRFNSALGPYTDRGFFQRYLRGMDDEYDLNIMMSRFTAAEDYLFFRSPGGFRSSVGVVNTERLLVLTELKHAFELAPDHRIDMYLAHQEDLQASRFYLDFEYQWNIYRDHHAGITQNITNEIADLNGSIFYQMGNVQEGMVKAQVGFPDYLNNVMFDWNRASVSFADTIRTYQNVPLLYSGSFISPRLWGFKAEAFVGFQPETKAIIESRNVTGREFRQNQWMNYMGGLIEYQRNFATVGITYQREFSRMDRDTLGISNINNEYTSRQIDERIGAYVMAGSDQSFWETWVWLVNSSDEQWGDNFDTARIDSFSFSEDRILLRNRFSYLPQHSGLFFALEHYLDLRSVEDGLDDMEFLAYRIRDFNSRFSAMVGYQFHPRARIVAGAALDIDGDFHLTETGDRYDNAFFRMEYRW